MSKIYDVTVPTHPKLAVWPGGPRFNSVKTSLISNGDIADVTDISMCVHTGTHVDGPRHFVGGAGSTEDIPLDKLVGNCVVVDLRGRTEITAADLEGLALPDGTTKVLFKTDNSDQWADPDHEFYEDYCAFTADGATWVREHGIHLVGMDYLSVSLYRDPPERVHQILLGAEIVCLEGLNLSEIEPGEYRLTCLPMRILDSDGAPARVILEG